MSVIDLISEGLIQNNQIQITVIEKLIDTFKKNWKILYYRPYKNSFYYPFYHLQNDSFWNVQFKSDFIDSLPKKKVTKEHRPRGLNRLKEVVEYASFDAELFELLQDKNNRKELTDLLIATWFSVNQKDTQELITINQTFHENDEQEEQQKQPKSYLRKSLLRDAFFRKAVVHTYNYKCAFCGMKVTTSIKQNIVDGAHIKPFAKFYDDRINNGISLCKNHHWAFDKGLFTISDDYDYKIIVSNNFQEESPNSKPIKFFHGFRIWLPSEKKYFPRIEALE
ncbi:HNH endonuclease [Dapis sp. BLCC M172]|uniref:HNH endonuclease n=1 Tax=Dapis sp. BLCC M172 TaxID=2975281 RepID=UPI003CF1E162